MLLTLIVEATVSPGILQLNSKRHEEFGCRTVTSVTHTVILPHLI